MKIIDKTPLLDEKGNLGPVQRIQGMLQYGFNWPTELQAQKAIITYFDRQLEKGYTLIRNYALGQSGIMVPMILLGPTGFYVINITHLHGRYEVKGDSWNVAAGEGYQPDPVNVIQQTLRMAKAVRAFIERQGTKIPVEIEPVLIAADPGLHIESVRPAVRVLLIDAIKSFVMNLATATPTMSIEQIYEFTERLINPRPPKKQSPAPVLGAEPQFPEQDSSPQEVSRARAIFDASQDVKPFNASDFDFAMDEETPLDFMPTTPSTESSPAQPITPSAPRSNRGLRMTPAQLAVIVGLILVLVCILAGFGYYVFFVSR
jgi:hypothetical protein